MRSSEVVLLVINCLLLVVVLTTAFAPATVLTNRLTCRRETTDCTTVGDMSAAEGNSREQRCRTRHPSTVGGSKGSNDDETTPIPNLKVIRGRAGPTTPRPTYDDSRALDRILLGLFRSKLAAEVAGDAYDPGYDGLMEMIQVLNTKFQSKRETQEASRRVLKSLFPSWLPASFAVMFSKPFPTFSARLNAWVTVVASQWLMGPSELNDVEIDGGSIGIGHGLLIERCRFLEAAGCASVCMNTCKVPTEEFFMKDMGLPLEMTPNYDDFSCQFSFNKMPLPRDVDESFRVACFEQCPSKGALRSGMQVARCHQIDVDPVMEDSNS